jgi:hypothetical protein
LPSGQLIAPDAFPDVSVPWATVAAENIVMVKSNNIFTLRLPSKFMTLSSKEINLYIM